jgi:hypothetical protein
LHVHSLTKLGPKKPGQVTALDAEPAAFQFEDGDCGNEEARRVFRRDISAAIVGESANVLTTRRRSECLNDLMKIPVQNPVLFYF